MAVEISPEWKKQSPKEILDSALPSELLVSEINPDFEIEEE